MALAAVEEMGESAVMSPVPEPVPGVVHGYLMQLACLLLLMWLTPTLGLASMDVTLLLSEPGGIHQQAADALRSELAGGPQNYQVRQLDVDEGQIGQADLMVAIGVKALRAALAMPGDTPVLALLVPRLTYTNLVRDTGPHRRSVTALYLEQPYARQMRLARVALPGARRLGVILGPTTHALEDSLEAAQIDPLRLDARRIEGPDDLFPALDDLAAKVDALMLVPDASVVGRTTLPSLLLHTYRRRLPVLGYSEALAQAGALLALYATPGQLGTEAARMIREAGPLPLRLPKPRFPRSFSLRINDSVARSLSIRLPPLRDLETALLAETAP